MPQITHADATAHLSAIGRGNLPSLSYLLERLVYGEVAAKMGVPPGVGITAGVGTICKSGVVRYGDIIRSMFLLDLTGLGSSTTDLDVIGVAGGPAYIGQINAKRNGTIIGGIMTCLKLPATGVTDIDLYSATEATPVFDDGIAASTETALVTSGGAWALSTVKALSAPPAANEYLYVCCGAAGTVGTYTAGKFLIDLYGYL